MWLSQSKTRTLIVAIAVTYMSPLCLHAEVPAPTQLWIQPLQTDLRSSPSMIGDSLIKLKRGDKVSFISKKDLWFEVEFQRKKGWVSKLFLSDHEPIGSADLSKDVQTSMEKTSRKRSSSYTVSASTRGLQANARKDRFPDSFPANYNDLKAMEDFTISDSVLEKFRQSAKLGEL